MNQLYPLTRDFYDRDTVIVAKALLGKWVIHVSDGVEKIGKIVEVEAYLGSHDLASHSAKGLTKRTRVMFGPPGHAYIYLIYGMHYCFNVVTEKEGYGAAVLIRALQPVKNLLMKTQGPGLLTKAMEIDLRLNGHDLLSPDFFVAHSLSEEHFSIAEKSRIGVGYAKEWSTKLLRFYIEGNQYVSKL